MQQGPRRRPRRASSESPTGEGVRISSTSISNPVRMPRSIPSESPSSAPGSHAAKAPSGSSVPGAARCARFHAASPVHWRWTPTVTVPFFTSPVSSTTSTAWSSSSARRKAQ